jgi:hypothetical protein
MEMFLLNQANLVSRVILDSLALRDVGQPFMPRTRFPAGPAG